MALLIDTASFVEIPWKERGRDVDGCDCYGLVRLVYLQAAGIDLPAWSDVSPDDARAVRTAIGSGKQEWMRVHLEEAQPLDVVLLHERPWHVGVVIRRGLMLHMPEGQSAVVEPYLSGRHFSRIEGIYRHASQNA